MCTKQGGWKVMNHNLFYSTFMMYGRKGKGFVVFKERCIITQGGTKTKVKMQNTASSYSRLERT